MNTYEALHTIDESGARIYANEGILIGTYADIDQAKLALTGYLGGYVRRTIDGATLCPDDTWASTGAA